MVKVGINGFGRMGRLATRFLFSDASEEIEIVHVNDAFLTTKAMSYLFEFDSIHGRYRDHSVAAQDDVLVVGANRVTTSSCATLEDIPWPEDVDLVLECSGQFNNTSALEVYFARGIKRVLVSAPVKGELNIVVGCNDNLITPDVKIVTAASCTTNCIGPVIKVMDEVFGIDHGCITTIHNVTNTQSIMDAANVKKDDLRRCRAGMTNLAPTSTGSAKAITMIFPHLTGKLNGMAIRVPLQNASITDLVLEVKRPVTVDEVNASLKAAAEQMPQVLGFEERPLVSTDYVNDERSSIVDAASTMVVAGTQVKIFAWYDNEFGYSRRMADIAHIMVKQMSK